MDFQRSAIELLDKKLKPGKVCLLLGARRTGKTVLLETYLSTYKKPSLLLNGEDVTTQQMLAEKSVANYKRLFSGIDLLIIDEAQVIEDIGKKLKLIVDHLKDLKVIVTGSSAFDILNISGEPLTGRSFVIPVFTISQEEIAPHENVFQTKNNLEERLIYGSYPELLNIDSANEKRMYLNEIVHSYLLKDILILDGIRNASKIHDLLKLLAFQVGKDVSYNELGNQLGISKNTVEKYLDLLTKVFVLKKITAYSNNLRKEIVKSSRWYFCDNGIRNALTGNFNPIALRQDIGELWENYMVMERIKFNAYHEKAVDYYFWRTYDQQELDFLEIENTKLIAFEFKWDPKKVKAPVAFSNAYPKARFNVVSQENYLDWITKS